MKLVACEPMQATLRNAPLRCAQQVVRRTNAFAATHSLHAAATRGLSLKLSDKHLVLRHRTPLFAPAAITPGPAEKKLKPDGDSLYQSGNLPHWRHDGFVHN